MEERQQALSTVGGWKLDGEGISLVRGTQELGIQAAGPSPECAPPGMCVAGSEGCVSMGVC